MVVMSRKKRVMRTTICVKPSLALIGPRSAGELSSTLYALGLSLSDAERAWLNLERDAR